MSQPRSTLARDVASAYLASGMRILSWVVVLGLVYRKLGPEAFGLLAMLRATIGILNYTSLGLGPAMIWMMSKARGSATEPAISTERAELPVLSYASPRTVDPIDIYYSNGFLLTLAAALIGALVTFIYSQNIASIHRITHAQLRDAEYLVLVIGGGTLLRIISDAAGAKLQATGRIADDNLMCAIAEVLWMGLAAYWFSTGRPSVVDAGLLYLFCAGFLLSARAYLAMPDTEKPDPHRQYDPTILRGLLSFGLLVTLSQLGDFLYAPVDYILINRFLSASALAAYAPAVQIDAAMLVLVSALAAVILPRSALAHAAGDHRLVRRYYVRGTLACCGILTAAAVVIYLASPLIFRLWLKDPMVSTQAILPLVLVHTVVGGSSAIGRAVLLGAGKVKAYTTSVLIAGVGNVVLSYVFVAVFNLGLTGIILGTIVVVTARCAIWMPWYVMRQITRSESLSAPDAAPPSLAP